MLCWIFRKIYEGSASDIEKLEWQRTLHKLTDLISNSVCVLVCVDPPADAPRRQDPNNRLGTGHELCMLCSDVLWYLERIALQTLPNHIRFRQRCPDFASH